MGYNRVYVTVLTTVFLFFNISSVFAMKGIIATKQDILRLKTDLKNGHIQNGETRLKDIRRKYGEAVNITESESKIVYDYGDLKLEFSKKRYWRSWKYDGFKSPVYTDDVDDLRYDLESGELVGKNITFSMIRKDYGEPTESYETNEDGRISVYYYGNIKMSFENVFLLTKWRAKNLGGAKQQIKK